MRQPAKEDEGPRPGLEAASQRYGAWLPVRLRKLILLDFGVQAGLGDGAAGGLCELKKPPGVLSSPSRQSTMGMTGGNLQLRQRWPELMP